MEGRGPGENGERSGLRVVRWRGVSDFGEFDGRPSPEAGKGNVGIDHGEIAGIRQADDVFVMQVVGEDTGDRMEVGEIAVIPDAIVDQLHRRETHGGHEVVGLGLGGERAGGVHLDVGLGNDRGKVLVFRIDGETFQPIGGLGKKHRVKTHSNEVVAERAGIHTMVEPLEPAPGFRIIVNLVFGSTALALSGPEVKEPALIEDMIVFLRPFPESLSAGAVNGSETAQLPELLRELRDFK